MQPKPHPIDFEVGVYHAKCMDGRAAAWLAAKRFPGIRLIDCAAGFHPTADTVNDVNAEFGGKNVLFLDISGSPEYMSTVGKAAKHVHILDHHKSYHERMNQAAFDLDLSNITYTYDEKLSACQLVANTFFTHELGDIERWFVDVIGDRDVFNFQSHPDSRNLGLGLYAFGYSKSFDGLDYLAEITEAGGDELNEFIATMAERGAKEAERRDAMCRIAVRRAQRTTFKHKANHKVYNVWLVQTESFLFTDVAEILLRHPFAGAPGSFRGKRSLPDAVAGWQYDTIKHRWKIAMRSVRDDVDVSKLILSINFMGGGHKSAAGCTLNGNIALRTFFWRWTDGSNKIGNAKAAVKVVNRDAWRRVQGDSDNESNRGSEFADDSDNDD